MHATVTTVKTSEQHLQNATLIGEEMESWLRDVEGFRGLLVLSRVGTSLGVTFWESREVAERYRLLRTQFLERITYVAELEVEEIVDYEVTFAQLAQELTGLPG